MGEDLDRRSDVFSIGILLWEMTTGQWLYRRKSELETLKAVAESDAPLPSRVHPGYPRELEQIVMKTLARKRDDRWATAGDLADAIGEFATRHRVNLSPATLGAMMQGLFTEEVAAWQDARRAGASLGDHLVQEREREERSERAQRGSDREVIAQTFDNAILLGEHETGTDDFESPTADHSLDERQESFDPELEDEPTTVLATAGQARALAQLPLRAPPPDAAPNGQGPPQRHSERRRTQPTDSVRTLPTQSSGPTRWPLSRRILTRLGLAGAERDPRWIWLIATGVLALLATIWLIATVLSDPGLPVPTKPAKTVPMEHPLG
jgi:hypothetical protein